VNLTLEATSKGELEEKDPTFAFAYDHTTILHWFSLLFSQKISSDCAHNYFLLTNLHFHRLMEREGEKRKREKWKKNLFDGFFLKSNLGTKFLLIEVRRFPSSFLKKKNTLGFFSKKKTL
jgi:hypothetical protein